MANGAQFTEVYRAPSMIVTRGDQEPNYVVGWAGSDVQGKTVRDHDPGRCFTA
ncbi:hypothetical protein [Streptomyces sp. N50]|uniref:hypothetical protein n=1 Tax=Streptomyces sp. N50 TaxID=3081765 RepID=UPI0029620371|nr:hypothetical protein [Streptomyces sp. N50]WOX17087.1 hypothetical protein R2B38_50910 [Streptomyces sp. N50]